MAEFSRPCPKNGYYDIFLSFRGVDTRFGFTANLYRLLKESKIYTFMDVKLTGEDIDYLFKMVAKSRMAVVIYSPTFASSDWCLNELEMILQRRKEKKMLMIPIFYKVDVHELKHLSGKTAEYLDKHIQEHGETTVKKWKEAIISLGKVSGLSYKDTHGRYEYDFIMDVIATIKEKLEEYEETLESGITEQDSNDFGNQDNKMKAQIVQASASHQNIEISPISQLQEHRDPSPDTTAGVVVYRIVTSNYVDRQQEGLDPVHSRVPSIDLHPTKPWVLLCWQTGTVAIWNQETRAMEKSFDVSMTYTNFAKFIPERHWIVVGDNKGFVRVLDYNTSKVKEFKAHEETVNSVAVHPTSPFVLTASGDGLIKLWNWENNWACGKIFTRQEGGVIQVAFNPKDSTSFASVCAHGSIKIWSQYSSIEKFTLPESDTPYVSVEYFVGNNDKLYLLIGGYEKCAQVWDYESRTLVKTLEGHTDYVWATLVHPKLPIIITTSNEDVRIWNKNTYRLEHVWKFTYLRRILCIGFIKSTNEVVLGCEDGMVVLKIVRDAGKRLD